MSDTYDPDENPTRDAAPRATGIPDEHEAEDVDALGLPDHEFLGMNPAHANKETAPGDPPVPDQAGGA